ncbi:MAG: hypothetical protein ABIQ62_03030 [Thermomonas sp.]
MAQQSKPTAATRPVDAINVLAARLLARDGAGFARLAVPPDLHARLQTGWREGRTRWPLDELPLDARLPSMLASLQEKGAQAKFKATFRRQFAGADRDIDSAIRTLAQFGGQYVQKEAEYNKDERDHVLQAIAALSRWASAAPLSDPVRADHFFTALIAAAQRSGIDGKAGKAAFAKLGMQSSLDRMSPFIATLLAQLRTQFGLDLDASLGALNVQLLEQTGDSARLRLRYQLAGSDIDAIVPAIRINGHWYLVDFVTRAEASLTAKAGTDAGNRKPASP